MRFLRLIKQNAAPACSLAASLILSACMGGPGFFQQNNSAILTDSPSTVVVPVQANADGTLTASLSADSGETQAIEAPAGSAVAGTAVNFPPGTLLVNTTVTMEEGASLASGDVATDLGLGGVETSNASTAVVISSSANIDATQPFTVNLALDSSAALALTQAKTQLVVFYKIKKVEEGDATFVGLIPNSELTVTNGRIAFKTRYFGSYQAVYIPAEITPVAEKPATKPIETKRETNTSTAGTGTGTTGGSTGSTTGSTGGTGGGGTTPTSTQVELTELTSTGSTDSSVTLSWRVPESVKEFIVVQAADVMLNGTTATATPPAKCAVTGATRITATALTGSRTITGLQHYKGYTFKVCAVALNGNVSDGKDLYVRTRDLPPYHPTNVTTRVESSRTVKLTFAHPANRPWRYRIAYAVGTTGGAQPSFPANCTGTASVMEIPTDADDFYFSELRTNSYGALRICGVNRDNVVSAGITLAVLSDPAAIFCDTGSLDSICQITTDVQVSGNTTVAGLGELHIKGGGVLRLSSPGRLTIDMKSKVLTEYASGSSYGEINVNGMGDYGGTSATNGAGTGGGKYYSSFAGGGAYGGQGGIDYGNPRSYDSISYGSYAAPIGMGSGGAGSPSVGTGGNGGGFLEIRTGRLVNNGLITAYGSNGGSGAGGGSGGGIVIYAKEIWADAGTYGYIKAPGGSGGGGGGGGGGRIAIHYQSGANSSLANFQILAPAGGANMAAREGAAGTIFINDYTTGDQELWVGGVGAVYPSGDAVARTPIDPSVVAPDMRKLKHLRILETTRAYLFSQPADFEIQNLTIAAGAALDHSGLGYKGFDGTAAGAPMGIAAAGNGAGIHAGGGGGGAAGAGGYGDPGSGTGGTGGSANTDSNIKPEKAGSGGGGGTDSGMALTARGGAGGGVLHLKVSGTVNLDGKIMANGAPGASIGSTCGGGGGGGAIYLEVGTILFGGSGQVEAAGGAGNNGCNSFGGGGGGGRIYIKAGSIGATNPYCEVESGTGAGSPGPGNALINTGGADASCPDLI